MATTEKELQQKIRTLEKRLDEQAVGVDAGTIEKRYDEAKTKFDDLTAQHAQAIEERTAARTRADQLQRVAREAGLKAMSAEGTVDRIGRQKEAAQEALREAHLERARAHSAITAYRQARGIVDTDDEGPKAA